MGTVILSLGMGADSVGIPICWLIEPETRWFDLSNLIVLTAWASEFVGQVRSLERR